MRINFVGNIYDNWEVVSEDKERNKLEEERFKNKEIKTKHKYWLCKCLICGEIQSIGSSSFSPKRKSITICVKCNSIGMYLLNTYGENGIDLYWGSNNKNDPFKVRKATRDKCWFKCEIHGEYYVNCGNFYFGQRCPYCSSSEIKPYVNDAYSLLPYDVIKNVKDKEKLIGVAKNSKNEITVVCPDCGNEKTITISLLANHGASCSRCSDGFRYPNKFMSNLLDKLKIKYIAEYSPEWIKPKRYDFYIPSMNLIIEMDGGFHYKDNNMSGQTKEEIESIDYLKDKKAESHGLDVIRINCHYQDISNRLSIIKNNTIKELERVINLDNVDWEEIDISSIDSKMKQAWHLWNIHKERDKYFTTTDLSKLMKINRTSIKKYLAKGRDFGLCNYDEHEERTLKCEKMYTKTSKKVEIFKNGISLGVFDSCCELERKSLELFGVKLTNSRISLSARNGKEYKGFTLLYKDIN